MNKALVLVAVVLLLLPTFAPLAFAEGTFAERREARQAQAQFAGNAAAFRQAAGRHLDLDLASTVASVAVTQAMLGSFAQASINVGGASRQVGAGDLLTPSEFVALAQVITGNSQNLTLGSLGEAIGGSFSVSDLNTSRFSNLVVPEAVMAVLSGASDLHVSQTLSAQGIVMGLGNNPENMVNIRAGNVLVSGSLVTGQDGSERPVNMTLFSASDISNSGTISASGFLSLYAAGEISNLSGNSTPATISGGQGVLLYSNAGKLTNSGNISALSGNVYFNSASSQSLVVNNVGGSVSANQGMIVLRDVGFTAKNLTNVYGGNFAANSMNIFGGDGFVDLKVNRIDGTINVTAGDAHVEVADGRLSLGHMELTGDPTYVNSGGDVLLGENISYPGQDVAILAKTNIVAYETVNLIDLSSKTGRGGDLYIMAGYTISPGTGPNGDINSTTTYSVSDASDEGGGIGLELVQIKTVSAGAFRGGNVHIYAHSGSEDSSGLIRIGGINTSSGKLDGGNVVVQGDGGEICVCGGIDTRGSRFGGSVNIAGATPDIDATMHFHNGTLAQDGGGISGTPSASTAVLIGDSILRNGNINTSAGVRAGDVTINAPGLLAVVGLINAGSPLDGGEVALSSTTSSVMVMGNITTTGTNATGNNVTIDAPEGIDVLGNITAAGKLGGGDVSLSSSGNGGVNVGYVYSKKSVLSLNPIGGIFTSSSAGEAGDVTIVTETGTARVAKGINANGIISGGNISVTSDGAIQIGGTVSATASSYMLSGQKQFGTGGLVTLTSELMGVETGAINTSGPGGGGKVLMHGVEVIIRGGVITDAKNSVDQGFTAGEIAIGAVRELFVGGSLSAQGEVGGAITAGALTGVGIINGSVNATGTLGTGGNILIAALTGMTITSDIISLGQDGGGEITMQCSDSLFSVGGSINAGGLKQSGAHLPGAGANIVLIAAGTKIKGSVLSQGGAATDNQNGADGGTIVFLSPSFEFDVDVTKRIGYIDIGGMVSVKGGAGNGAMKVGGAGGAVELDAGTVQIRGSSGGSVITLGGKGSGGGADGESGLIIIQTFDCQPIPLAFDLGSSVASEYALPGAMFEIGNASVNGSAGPLVAGGPADTLSTSRVFGQKIQGKITVDAQGADSVEITQDGVTKTVNLLIDPLNINSPRTKLTPAQALAVYQITRGTAQTIGLTASGAASNLALPGNTAPNSILIPGLEFNRPMTAFNIRTGVSGEEFAMAVGIILTDAQASTRLIMSPSLKTATITGILDFVGSYTTTPPFSSTARLDLGNTSLSIAPTGRLRSDDTQRLEIIGANTLSIVNIGKISSRSLVLRNTADKGSVSLTLGGNSPIDSGEDGTLGGVSIISGRGNTNLGTIKIQNLIPEVPGKIVDLAVLMIADKIIIGSSKLTNGNLVINGPSLEGVTVLNGLYAFTTATFNFSSTVNITGAVSTGQDLIINSGDDLLLSSVACQGVKSVTFNSKHDIFLDNTNNFIVDKDLTFNAGVSTGQGMIEDVSIGGGNIMLVVGKLTVNGASGIVLEQVENFGSGSNMLFQSLGDVSLNGLFAAGARAKFVGSVYVNNLVSQSMVKTVGSISISGDSITLGTTNFLYSLGSGIKLVALAGDINLGDSSNYVADGGSISVIASHSIIGGTPIGPNNFGNTFTAKGFTSGGGGGIELLAGTTTSQVAAELKARPTPPSIVAGGTTASVGSSVKGKINVSGVTFLPTPANNFIEIENGVVLIRNLGAVSGSEIKMNTAGFAAASKVSYLPQVSGSGDEQIIDTGDYEESSLDIGAI
jgi:hypothetical protein